MTAAVAMTARMSARTWPPNPATTAPPASPEVETPKYRGAVDDATAAEAVCQALGDQAPVRRGHTPQQLQGREHPRVTPGGAVEGQAGVGRPYPITIAAAAAYWAALTFPAPEFAARDEGYRAYRCALYSDVAACRQRAELPPASRMVPGPYATKLIVDGWTVDDALAEARRIGEAHRWHAPAPVSSTELPALERYERRVGRWNQATQAERSERAAWH